MSGLPPGYEYLAKFRRPVIAVRCHDPSHAENPWYVAFFGHEYSTATDGSGKRILRWKMLDASRITKNELWSPDRPELIQSIHPSTNEPIPPVGIGLGGTSKGPLPEPWGTGSVERFNIRCNYRVRGRACGVTVPVRRIDRLHRVLDLLHERRHELDAPHGVPTIPLTMMAAMLSAR